MRRELIVLEDKIHFLERMLSKRELNRPGVKRRIRNIRARIKRYLREYTLV